MPTYDELLKKLSQEIPQARALILPRPLEDVFLEKTESSKDKREAYIREFNTLVTASELRSSNYL